ncbi:c-type cytochrome biogenesis protein CcmI [uncultured Ferrimonas sp.]|uniref:c-type cytochrome biogenesis protein CcmI n=1 Tax=uncultured Ferrimonas sp. TaxID=432640 RepID=UPI0026290D3D|nr:c-type cytochrome biogenesis protein CcmI [uncultured Ferrimonas sp.]
MTNFWIAIAALTVLALCLIWLPFVRRHANASKATDAETRKQTNLSLYNERLDELNAELSEGRINEQEHSALQQELQINLLQNVEQEEDNLAASSGSIVWPIAMSVVLVAISGYVYNDLGRGQDWNVQTVQNDNPHAGMTPEQMASSRIEQMETALMADPENSQGWFSLGHAYINASQYGKAIAAFDKTMELVGEHAELLGPKATAMYYQADQNMTPAIEAVIAKSLASDNKDPSTRLLLGMDAFFSANYEDAIGHWEMILTNPRQDVDREGILNAISQAKMFLEAGSANQAKSDENIAANNSGVTVTVEIAPELAANAKPTDTVFLFARAVNGDMPLAVARIAVADLPNTIVLDDSFAMTPQMVISGAEQVDLIAAINLNNSKKPTPGDMQGELQQVEIGASVTVTIDTVVE